MKEKLTYSQRLGIIGLSWIIFFLLGYLAGGCTVKNMYKAKEKVAVEAPSPAKVDSLDDWTILQMAIMLTESEYNPKAVGKTKDYGILQITPVYVKECNRILREEKYVHEDAFDIDKSLEMFYIIQSHYNPDEDLDTAIRCHNRAGWYAQRVKSNIVKVKRMEEARRKVIEKRQEI